MKFALAFSQGLRERMNFNCTKNLRTEIVPCKNGQRIYMPKLAWRHPNEALHSNNSFRHHQLAGASYPAPQSEQSDRHTGARFLDLLNDFQFSVRSVFLK